MVLKIGAGLMGIILILMTVGTGLARYNSTPLPRFLFTQVDNQAQMTQLVMAIPDAGYLRQLSEPAPQIKIRPLDSADSRVYFYAGERIAGIDSFVYEVNLNNGHVAEIMGEGSSYIKFFGDWVVYLGENSDLYSYNLTTRKRYNLTQGQFTRYQNVPAIDYAYEGEWLQLRGWRPFTPGWFIEDFARVNLDGTNFHRQYIFMAYYLSSYDLLDADTILFNTRGKLYLMDADGRHVRELIPSDLPKIGNAGQLYSKFYFPERNVLIVDIQLGGYYWSAAINLLNHQIIWFLPSFLPAYRIPETDSAIFSASVWATKWHPSMQRLAQVNLLTGEILWQWQTDKQIKLYGLTPDNTSLLMTQMDNHASSLWLMDVHSGHLQKVAELPNYSTIDVLDWTSDGQWLYFQLADGTSQYHYRHTTIYRMQADGSGFEPLIENTLPIQEAFGVAPTDFELHILPSLLMGSMLFVVALIDLKQFCRYFARRYSNLTMGRELS